MPAEHCACKQADARSDQRAKQQRAHGDGQQQHDGIRHCPTRERDRRETQLRERERCAHKRQNHRGHEPLGAGRVAHYAMRTKDGQLYPAFFVPSRFL